RWLVDRRSRSVRCAGHAPARLRLCGCPHRTSAGATLHSGRQLSSSFCRDTAVAEHKLVAIRLELWKELLRQVSAGALVRLVDQPHDPRAVVHADGWRRASPPVVERIAHCGKIGRANAGAWEGLVPLGGGELHDAVLHGENGITTGDLPLAISAVTGEAVAYLYGTDNAARRAEHYRSVVLNRAFMRASAQLGASHLRLLTRQVEEHVEPVRAQVSEAATAGLGGIETPGTTPGLVTCRPRPIDPDVDVRQPAEAPRGEQLAGARGEAPIALGQRDSDERTEPGPLGGHRLHLRRVDPHWLLHQEGIALVEQAVGDRGHLPVPPECHDQVAPGRPPPLSLL